MTMEKIITYLNSIAKDRYQHYSLGVMIATITFILSACWLGFWWALPISVVAVVAAAKLKEVYDSKNGGCFDWTDFIVTCAGGVAIWIVAVIIWIIR